MTKWLFILTTRQKFFEFSTPLRIGGEFRLRYFIIAFFIGMRKDARELDIYPAERHKEFDTIKFLCY